MAAWGKFIWRNLVNVQGHYWSNSRQLKICIWSSDRTFIIRDNKRRKDESIGALTLAFVGPFRLLRLAYLTFFVSRQERWKRWHFFVRLHRSQRSWREKKASRCKRCEFGACSKVRSVPSVWGTRMRAIKHYILIGKFLSRLVTTFFIYL